MNAGLARRLVAASIFAGLSTHAAVNALSATGATNAASKKGPSASSEDANKPVNIEADRGSYDDLKQVAVFTGNVVLTRGSLVIRADRIEVRQSPEGFQFGSAYGTGDKLASFRQVRPGPDNEVVEGYGERIDYDGQNDLVTLIQRAQMRRLQDGVVFDEISGHTINYNNRTDVYSVAGGASVKDPGNPQGRVRAVIAPRLNTTDSKGAGSKAIDRSTAGTRLRSTSEISTPPAQ